LIKIKNINMIPIQIYQDSACKLSQSKYIEMKRLKLIETDHTN
jgi:hypothetical protein